jgi:hypothetical protein
MSKELAPWINLTQDKPGLDAQSRDAINEWCGVVGRKEQHRHPSKRTIKFPSRAVNWKHQRRPNSGPLKVSDFLKHLEAKTKPVDAFKSTSSTKADSVALKATGTGPAKTRKKSKGLDHKKDGEFINLSQTFLISNIHL